MKAYRIKIETNAKIKLLSLLLKIEKKKQKYCIYQSYKFSWENLSLSEEF